MKKVVAALAVVGMVAGLVLAAGTWFFRVPAPIGALVASSVLGLLVIATHRFNWTQLRDPDPRFPSRLLFGFNLALMAFFLVAFDFALSHSVLVIAFYLLFPLPLAANAAYLCAPTAAGWPLIRCGLFGLVLVATALVRYGPLGPMPESSYESSGRVLEGGTGHPLIGARVTLDCMGSTGFVTRTLQTTSGPNGAYEFKRSDIRRCDSINVHASKDGYVTGGLDSTYGRDDRYHVVLTPPSELTVQRITGLAIGARGTRSPNPGYHYALVFSTFFEATQIAKTDREVALVREEFCPLLIDIWSSLSEEDRSFARAQRLQTTEGAVAVVDHDGAVLPYCARKE